MLKTHYHALISIMLCNFVAKSVLKSPKSLILLDYSMIVATRPEPTILPPSRFSVGEIWVILCDFQDFFGVFFFDMHLVSEVL